MVHPKEGYMDAYPKAALERAMKVQEVILQAISGFEIGSPRNH